MAINYESAWKQLKMFVSDMESYTRPYKGNGFQAVLFKMEELEKSLATVEPKPDIKIGEFTLERSKLPKFTAEDFKVAKEAFEANTIVYGIAHELESQLIEASNAAAREVDTWILDIFKTLETARVIFSLVAEFPPPSQTTSTPRIFGITCF